MPLLMIVGLPFTGKTTSAATFPKPARILDFNGGVISIFHARDRKGEFVVPDSDQIEIVRMYERRYQDLEFKTAEKKDFASDFYPKYTEESMSLINKFNKEMKRAEADAGKLRTLILDSYTDIQRLWKDAIMFTNKIPQLRIADYGTLEGLQNKQFLPSLKYLKEKLDWVILINHETMEKDEISGMIVEQPIGPSNQMGRVLSREFDEVWRQVVDASGNYIWRTRKHGLFVGAGTRLHLPEIISPATYQELSKYLGSTTVQPMDTTNKSKEGR